MLAPRPQGVSDPRLDIEILEVHYIRGPGRWTYRAVLEAVVDIGGLEEYPSNLIPGLPQRLEQWLPGLVEHRCSYGERGGFLRRLHEGTWPAHILEHVAVELQSLAGAPGAGFGRARETSTPGVYRVVIRAFQEQTARAALSAARDLVMAAIEDRPFDVAGTVASLRALNDEHYLGPSTESIVLAADDRSIPFVRLNDGNLVQLGYGAAQHRIWTAETDRTSAIAEGISRDKDLTKELLRSCGVPVPEGRPVADAEDAWAAAMEVGLPVVVKPSDGNHGRGVFTNLISRDEVLAAWNVAREEGSGVIVERFVHGNEHRLLVVGGKVVAATRGEPAQVVGDGRCTVSELIDLQLNSHPLRGSTEDCPLNFVRIDSSARIELARQGFDADSIPPTGTRLLIQRNGNVSIDVTDELHPEVAAMAALAADVVGLDIAGIDLVADDISRPLDAQRGAIVEVNAGPGLLMHLKPAAGRRRPVGEAIVEHLFPGAADGRIPIIGVAGTRSGSRIAALVAALLRGDGNCVGLATADGLFVDGRRIFQGNAANWEQGRRLLRNRFVECAVIENGARSIVSEGLSYDRCSVGIVSSLERNARIDAFDVASADQMYAVLRTQVDVVLPNGTAVLDAGDPMIVEMSALCEGETIFYASTPRGDACIEAHLGEGRRAVRIEGGRIALRTGTSVEYVGDDEAFGNETLDDLLPAIAAAWAAGIPAQRIAERLEALFRPIPVAADATA
ncbi:MAG: cyanophycin synthetase [Burkholderiaceae bacterium]|nr:cyanophycin synthetase [Burkholderiaceae bacterium]